jgi:hypothetical protein
VSGRTLYVNTTNEVKKVILGKDVHGIFSDRRYKGEIELPPYGEEFVQ